MEIQKGIKEYKRIYWISLRAMLLIALGLTVLIASLSFYFNTDLQVLQILLTISVGSIFFTVIVFNAAVLVIFGHSSISTWSVLIIIISELATIPYIHTDIWFSSLGFMLGSFIGFVVSFFVTIRMFSFPEYRMFRFLLKSP
jgi:O-antigen/teichoic acid export membrane protein